MVACLPAVLVTTYYFGIGTILNLLLAAVFAVAFEALAVAAQGRDIRSALSDNSVLVTAILLGLSMPPGSPWWLIMIGIFFAVIIAKHCFGGLGQNLFNPAMCGYAMLLLTFPLWNMHHYHCITQLSTIATHYATHYAFFTISLSKSEEYA